MVAHQNCLDSHMRILAAVVVLVTLFATPCVAQVPRSAIDQLRNGSPQAAERAFSALQTSFENGRVTEYQLLDAYKHFYREDAALASGLDEWIRVFPQSPSAYLARGVYFRKRGEQRRGTNYIEKTPSADLAYMMSMFRKAKPDLAKSLQLNGNSYIAELHVLNIAMHEGDVLGARKALENATRILPSNILARARYTASLQPRWGGSYAQMDAFIARCRSEGVPEGTVALLESIKFEDLGSRAEEKGRLDDARAYFERALPLSRAGGPRFRDAYLYNALRFCRHYKFGGTDCS
jgi:tetratricopeptide (TPR) repeat protein